MKYPYIEDKRMYAAVMGACSWIRESGKFNRAVRYFAKKYGVDEEELAAQIRARQGAGQKGKTSVTKGKRYRYFLVSRTVWTEANGEKYFNRPEVLRGLTAETVLRRFAEADEKETARLDYGGAYAPEIDHVVCGEYETRAEAEEALSVWDGRTDGSLKKSSL